MLTTNLPEPTRETLKETLATEIVKVTTTEGISIVKTSFKQAYLYPTKRGNIIGFPVNLKRETKVFKEV